MSCDLKVQEHALLGEKFLLCKLHLFHLCANKSGGSKIPQMFQYNYNLIIIHQTFLLMHDWSKHVMHMTEYAPAKIGEYPRDSIIFSTVHVKKNIGRIISTISSI